MISRREPRRERGASGAKSEENTVSDSDDKLGPHARSCDRRTR